jgi:diguanylate cyclase (GGDEF)-like protein
MPALNDIDRGNGHPSLALDVAGEGMVDWDLTCGTIVFSARWCELMGLPAVSMVATADAWKRLVHDDDVVPLFNALRRLNAGHTRMASSYRVRDASGGYRRMTIRARIVCDAHDTPTRILAWQSDRPVAEAISNLTIRELKEDAESPLAGQIVMAERLEAAVADARCEGKSTFVLLAIDIDGFTAISASYGKDASHRLLAAVGERLRARLQPADTIARYGCDEFCILARCSSENPQADISARIQRQLADPFALEGRDIAVSVSVGIARVLPTHTSAASVSSDAYAAVHHAKMNGGNQCAVFDAAMHESTRARLQLEAELRHAFERDEFVLHYQPIVHCATGALVALEALIRWEHPVRGCLPPSEFLEVLASTGLLTDVGRWIVSEVCRQWNAWRRSNVADVYVSINVSPLQLVEPGFVEDVITTLAVTGTPASAIAFEITEDLALGDGEIAMRALYQLRENGIHVRIDDFGTGYSSLSYLQRLPVAGLKIDRAFLDQLENDGHRRAIVGAIVALAHVLGLDVVAEGVERSEQLEELQSLGCDFLQGYHISPPMTSQAIPEWVATMAPSPQAGGRQV